MLSASFWQNRRVFLTGHTGFKGSWMCLWLTSMGARVTGYALAPPTEPALFDVAGIADLLERSIIADVRDGERLADALRAAEPEVVIHMAAQPLVRDSYRVPVETFETNIMGSVHLLEAVRTAGGVRAVVNVTTDKVYLNREQSHGYLESDPLGGHDPYSASKAGSEIVTQSYRGSFFSGPQSNCAVASARAGNVIGGGDWANDRLVPDFLRSLAQGDSLLLRSPNAVRPWQHVLEPLSGYLLLAERLHERGQEFASAWNFGPEEVDHQPVEKVIRLLSDLMGEGTGFTVDKGPHPHETTLLYLDCSRARSELGWHPRWHLREALEAVAEWSHAVSAGKSAAEVCLQQIDAYVESDATVA